jgi:peptidoglycan L-alanyl-D-glutamate endopeptidase CwlK
MDLGWFKYLFPGQIERAEEELKILKDRKRAVDMKRAMAYFAPTASEQLILNDLHPLVSNRVVKVLNRATQQNLYVILYQGIRTFQQQDALYKQGRNEAGEIVDKDKVVTYAKPGTSWHNYACAVDIVMNMGPRPKIHPTWDSFIDENKDGVNDWVVLGQIGKDYGFEWGGEFKGFVDVPHFQYHRVIATAADALELYNKGGLPEVWKRII